MKLEIGKKYKSRSGKVYVITSFNGYTYGYDRCPAMWYEDGHCLFSREAHRDDLIEEVKETNMKFLTTSGVRTLNDVKALSLPPTVGDMVKFYDQSYACYVTETGLVQASCENGIGRLIATDLQLPSMPGQSGNTIPNDAIVFINGRTYFARLAFLKRA